MRLKLKLKLIELMMRLRNPFPSHPYIPFHPHPIHTRLSFHSALSGSVSAPFSSPHQFMISPTSKTHLYCTTPPHGPKMEHNRMMSGVCSARRSKHSVNIQARQSAGFGDKLAFTSTVAWNRDVPKYVIILSDTDFRTRVMAMGWVISEQSPDSVSRPSRLVGVTRRLLVSCDIIV